MPMIIRRFTRLAFAAALAMSATAFSAVTAQAGKVNITPDIPFLDITIGRKTIHIERIQDTNHRLKNSYTKTSRACPPHCIQPMTPVKGVRTVGELELLDFLQNKVAKNKGVLVDARIPVWYKKGTIPGSVNIPFTLFSSKNNPYLERILMVLGAEKLEDGTWDFGNARELLLFCNGPWCAQSPRAIRNLIAAGYPPSKLHYYRGGMQNWQIMGFPVQTPGRKKG